MPDVAVVTGASRGIGRAVALSLSARGLRVALVGRDAGRLAETGRAIADAGGSAVALVCDVVDMGAVSEMARRVVTELGVPRVVINNAGVVTRAPVSELADADWDRVIGTNLSGVFRVTRAFLTPMLAAKRGRFVALSSISGTLGTPNLSAYCASKWGVIGFTKALAEELAGSGLQAVCVAPGSVETDMLKGSGFAPRMRAEDVAELITYAALDAPAATNGTCIEMFGP